MQSIQHIKIDEPCQQNWQDMTHAPGGRRCSSCSKVVTDFTGMNNEQIIHIMTNAANVCGRFETWQLNSINRRLQQAPSNWFNWKKFGLTVGLFFIFSIGNVSAQQKKGKAHYARHVPVKHIQVKPDSLIAFYMINEMPANPVLTIKAKQVANTTIEYRLNVVLGGIVAVRRVSEPVSFIKDGCYQNLMDLFQIIIKL
jgi:hypothetical protein